MDTKISHNNLKSIRIETSTGRAYVFSHVKDSQGNPKILLREFLSVNNGTVIPHSVMAQEPRVISYGTIKDVSVLDDQGMGYIHYNNASKPKEVQLPLFPNPVTTGLKNE